MLPFCHRSLFPGLFCFSVLAGLLSIPLIGEPELAPEELVRRHLESLGSDQAIADVKYRVAEGVVVGAGRVFKQRGQKSGTVLGYSHLETGPEKLRLTLVFESRYYPIDGFLLVDRELRRPAVDVNTPSFLTEFFGSCIVCLEDGLLGGVLSNRWPLLHVDAANPEFDVLGKENLDGVELIAVRYHRHEGRTTKLYFDPIEMRHVATRYRSQVGRGRGYRASEVFLEEFGEFETVDGLCLPTLWKFTYQALQETTKWEVEFSRIEHPKGPILKRGYGLPGK